MNKKIIWIDVTPEDDELFFNEEDDEEDDSPRPMIPNMKKIAIGPFGAFEMHDFASPYSDHIIYSGHTNFLLTNELVDLIDKCEGVDILRVPSKYTFHIGIGLGFDIEDVLFNIELALNVVTDEFFDDEGELSELSEIVSEITEPLKEHDHWAIYVFPNGNYEHATCDGEETEEYLIKVEELKNLKKVSQGLFLTNAKDN